MNSICRSIDLTIGIVARIAVGQLMIFVSQIVTAVTIAGWNVASFSIEYFLLRKIYDENPQLAIKAQSPTSKIKSFIKSFTLSCDRL